MITLVWTIAGSDNSGGAGIQADLITGQDLGCHVATIVTSVTAQNALGVQHVEAVSLSSLEQQLASTWQTLKPQAIKIGLIANLDQMELLAQWLAKVKQTTQAPIVWDPVMVASNQGVLADWSSTTAQQSLQAFLAQVDVVTPNLVELAELSGLSDLLDAGLEKLVEAVEPILAQGCQWVLAKGGHGKNKQAVDYLIGQQSQLSFASQRIVTEHHHGTGCGLSMALASCLGLGYPIEDAVCVAKARINQGLKVAQPLGVQNGTPNATRGWPKCRSDFPVVNNKGADFPLGTMLARPPAFASLDTHKLGLYPVVDSSDWIFRLLTLGIKTVQLRIKDPEAPNLKEEIRTAVELGEKFSARVFINDHWRLALELGAYGVHLGQEDLATADLAAISRAGLRLGVSTHGYFELLRAIQLKPSYIALGHIFPTTTKDMPSKPQGVERLKRYVQLCEGIPTVAIGGIDLTNARSVLATGVGSVAVVRAVTEAQDLMYQLILFDHIIQEPWDELDAHISE